ncbi:hypothetical protein [Paenibacillus sp. NPDC057967]|uniref:hypothetical protein n=1 Tax=Paenibacillus sp. NPDC057967 TaxID=3346293 RepID=UPI0036DD6E9D
MSDYIYICPACRTHNDQSANNCIRCGHWMLSTTYPPIIVKKKSSAAKIIGIVAICFGGIVIFGTLLVVVFLSTFDGSSSTNGDTRAAVSQSGKK